MTSNPRDLHCDRANEILNTQDQEKSLSLAFSCSYLALQLKGENLKLFYPKMKSPLADYVLLTTATNITQATAIADLIIEFLKKQKISYKMEGYDQSQWILIDINDVLVHIFLPETREIYNLDQLYSTIAKIQLPEDFYTQKLPAIETISNQKSTNYQDYF